MAKTKEELKELKTEYETLNNKPGSNALTDDLLKKAVGGIRFEVIDDCGYWVCTKCGKRFNFTEGNFATLHEERCKG